MKRFSNAIRSKMTPSSAPSVPPDVQTIIIPVVEETKKEQTPVVEAPVVEAPVVEVPVVVEVKKEEVPAVTE